MSIYKSRKSKQEFENFPGKVEELKKLFLEMPSKHEKPLSKITIINYVNKLNKLSTIVLGHGWNGKTDWLKNATSVIKSIEDSDATGKKDLLTPVVKLLKTIDSSQELIAEYQKGMSVFKDAEYKIRKDNKATPEEVNNSLPLEDILKHINDYKPTDDMTLIYKLICSLYFQNSLVLRNDLPTMKFVSTNKKVSQMNNDYNYITLDKNKTPIEIIMKNYKSRNTYGTQKFPITPEVRSLLKDYIKSFGKQAGDFLFVMKDGKEFSKPNFLGLLGNATESVLGKRILVDQIRKIQISHYYQTVHSINETEDDSRRYLHSSSQHLEYLRQGLHQADSDD